MSRKIQALRNLAERPGTEAEGRVAQEKLARALRSKKHADPIAKFRTFLRTGKISDLADAVGTKTCPCGAKVPAFASCIRTDEHDRIRHEIRERFPRGTRVFYNQWAYKPNQPAVVMGYSVAHDRWNYIRLVFDELDCVQSVPIYSAPGKWHLSDRPLTVNELRVTDLRGGMENIDGHGEEIEREVGQ